MEEQNNYQKQFVDFFSYYYGEVVYKDNQLIFKGLNEDNKGFLVSFQKHDAYVQLSAACCLEGFSARCETQKQFEDMLKHCLKVCKPKGKEYSQGSLF